MNTSEMPRTDRQTKERGGGGGADLKKEERRSGERESKKANRRHAFVEQEEDADVRRHNRHTESERDVLESKSRKSDKQKDEYLTEEMSESRSPRKELRHSREERHDGTHRLAKSSRRDKSASPKPSSKHYQEERSEKVSKHRRSERDTADYEAVSDEDDHLESRESASKKESKKKRHREKSRSRDCPEDPCKSRKDNGGRRVFYDEPDSGKGDESRERSKRSKRDSNSDRKEDREVAESEKQRLRLEKAKSFLAKHHSDAVDSPLGSRDHVSDEVPGSQWVSVSSSVEKGVFKKKIKNERAAKVPHDESGVKEDKYDPVKALEGTEKVFKDFEITIRSRSPDPVDEQKMSKHYLDADEKGGREKHRDVSGSDSGARKRSSHRQRSSSRNRSSYKEPETDGRFYDSLSVSPTDLEESFNYPSDSAENRRHSRRRSASRERASRPSRRRSSRSPEEDPEEGRKSKGSTSRRASKDESIRRSRRSKDVFDEPQSKRRRDEVSTEKRKPMERSPNRSLERQRSPSHTSDNRFKHPGSPVDRRRRSHRDSLHDAQSDLAKSSTDSRHERPEASSSPRRSSRTKDRDVAASDAGSRRRSSRSGRRSPEPADEESSGDLRRLESELKDFGDRDEKWEESAGRSRRRERSPNDEDVEVDVPTSESEPMPIVTRMADFANIPMQYMWPKVKEERDLVCEKTGNSSSQKEKYSSEVLLAKFQRQSNGTNSSQINLDGSGSLMSDPGFDKLRKLKLLMEHRSSSKFASGTAGDMNLRDEIRKCSNLMITVNTSHPTFKTFKSLSKSFLVKTTSDPSKSL